MSGGHFGGGPYNKGIPTSLGAPAACVKTSKESHLLASNRSGKGQNQVPDEMGQNRVPLQCATILLYLE